MVGLDTGFFIKLLSGEKTSIEVWKDLMENKYESAICPLTFFELEKLSLKGAIDKKPIEVLFNAIEVICKILWLNDVEIFKFSSKLSHGTGIPAVDSIILGSFLKNGVTKVFTTDSHFLQYKNKNIEIVKL